jgi:hypothetical protein
MDTAPGEDISVLLQLSQDFPYDDLHRVAALLREANVFVPGYLPPPGGLYDPDIYLLERRVNDVEFVILPDRNIASRISSVAAGAELNSSRNVAAAIMAFAQCLDFNFEPSIAFHELAHSAGNTAAMSELRSFRLADQPRPQEWLDVALGRLPLLVPSTSEVALPEADLAKPLRRWIRNYILALKVAELELQQSNALEKIMHLMNWMFSDFIWAGPALVFASLYFAPSAPRKRMLKHLRSPIRGRAIAGVRNAAWDMTHLSEFLRLVYEQGSSRKRYLLATSDKTMARLCPALLYGDEVDDDRRAAVANRLAEWWSEPAAEAIAAAFWSYQDGLDDPSRQRNREAPASFLDDLVFAGEALLSEDLNPQPSRTSLKRRPRN